MNQPAATDRRYNPLFSFSLPRRYGIPKWPRRDLLKAAAQQRGADEAPSAHSLPSPSRQVAQRGPRPQPRMQHARGGGDDGTAGLMGSSAPSGSRSFDEVCDRVSNALIPWFSCDCGFVWRQSCIDFSHIDRIYPEGGVLERLG
jgi:hypothetical protein